MARPRAGEWVKATMRDVPEGAMFRTTLTGRVGVRVSAMETVEGVLVRFEDELYRKLRPELVVEVIG